MSEYFNIINRMHEGVLILSDNLNLIQFYNKSVSKLFTSAEELTSDLLEKPQFIPEKLRLGSSDLDKKSVGPDGNEKIGLTLKQIIED